MMSPDEPSTDGWTRRAPLRDIVVVVVDDDEDIRALTNILLTMSGIRETVTAMSVEQAKERDWTNVHAAIIDWSMPGENGGVLLQWLRDNHPKVRLAVVTAFDTVRDEGLLEKLNVPMYMKSKLGDALIGLGVAS